VFHQGLAWVAQIAMFLALGLLVFPSSLGDVAVKGTALALVLIFVARPLVVFGCLLLDRRGSWTWEEVAFLAWTRETGVVPAALAGIIVAMHVPNADLVVTSVALAIIVTLGLQSTTKHWLARRLRLLDGDVQPPPSPPFPAPASVSPTIGS